MRDTNEETISSKIILSQSPAERIRTPILKRLSRRPWNWSEENSERSSENLLNNPKMINASSIEAQTTITTGATDTSASVQRSRVLPASTKGFADSYCLGLLV